MIVGRPAVYTGHSLHGGIGNYFPKRAHRHQPANIGNFQNSHTWSQAPAKVKRFFGVSGRCSGFCRRRLQAGVCGGGLQFILGLRGPFWRLCQLFPIFQELVNMKIAIERRWENGLKADKVANRANPPCLRQKKGRRCAPSWSLSRPWPSGATRRFGHGRGPKRPQPRILGPKTSRGSRLRAIRCVPSSLDAPPGWCRRSRPDSLG